MGKIVVKETERCNAAQREFILAELATLRKNEYDYKKAPLPADLRAAQRKLHTVNRKINAFRSLQERLVKQRIKLLNRRIASVRKAVHFDSAETALRMLEALQADAK